MKKSNKRKIKKTRIANKTRFIAFCALCVFILTICIGSLTSAQATKCAETYTLCISSGDTLWEIARGANSRGKDIRNVIDDIMKLNNMRGTDLKIGDSITIPIY